MNSLQHLNSDNNDNNVDRLNKIMSSTAHKQFNRLGTAANTISLSTSSPLIAKYMSLSTFSGGIVNNNANDERLSSNVPSTTSPEVGADGMSSTKTGLNSENYLSTKLNVNPFLSLLNQF